MKRQYLFLLIFVIFCSICSAEEYLGICSLVSQDDKTATFESAGMSSKSIGIEENAIKSLFYSLFYNGIEEVNHNQPLIQKRHIPMDSLMNRQSTLFI